MVIQFVKVVIETRSWSQLNTVFADEERDMYPRHMNTPNSETQTQGIENRLRRMKTFGALPFMASPISVLVPPRTLELPEDQAEVMTTALMIDGTTLIPARVAAITNGDPAAPPCFSRSGSSDGITKPTMKMEITIVTVKLDQPRTELRLGDATYHRIAEYG